MIKSVDKLLLLRGRDIEVAPGITIHQPTVDEIADYGEDKFFSTFYSLCSIPSDMKSVLWDANLDFTKVSDWQLFIMMSKSFSKDDTSIILGDMIDFSLMEPMHVGDTDEIVLVDNYNQIIISEDIYMDFIPYIRETIGYVLKREKPANKYTKQVLIEEDREKRLNSAGKVFESSIFPIIVSLVNTEEFSYTYEETYRLTFYQLLKSYFQIQNKKSACALYQGSMSGFVDTSKINKNSFSWIFDESKFN